MNVARFTADVNLANAQKEVVLFVTTKESRVQYFLNNFTVADLIYLQMR